VSNGERKPKMRTNTPSLLCLLSLAIATLLGRGTATVTPSSVKPSHYTSTFNRTLFPSTFLFGLGSSAYQVILTVITT